MSRNISLLLLLLAITISAFVVLTGINNSNWNDKSSYGQYYFPGLNQKINDVNKIKLSQSDNVFEIVRQDDTWLLKNKDDYPADNNKVKTNLLALSNAIKIEPKTKKESLLKKLHLEDPSVPGSKSFLMELYNDDAIIASAVIGNRKPNLLKRGEFGVYLRETDGYESWLVSGNLNASDGIKNWISTRLLEFIPDDISSMTVTRGNRTVLKFGRDPLDNNKFMMIDFLEGVETRTSIGLRSVMRRFLKVDFRDMREAQRYTQDPDTVVEILTVDGNFINIELNNDLNSPGAWVSIVDTDHPEQMKNIGYEFYLDENYKEEFIIKLEDVLKID
jgi:hypothetical protein